MRKIYNYGQIIRAKRQNKNIKAITLAKDLGITPAYLSLIESNQRKPDGDLLLRIQDLLELQKEDLTKRTDPDLESRTQEIVKISLLEDQSVILNIVLIPLTIIGEPDLTLHMKNQNVVFLSIKPLVKT